jgi:hypothetical protein
MTLSWDKEIKLIWLSSMITLLGLMALVAYVEVKENEKIQCGIAQKHIEDYIGALDNK